MGTNFYLHTSPKPCPTCGHDEAPEPLHIGKSSAGWCFALHVIPERGINDLPDWQREWSKPGVEIKDEYGRSLSPEEMTLRIVDRTWPKRKSDRKYFHEANHSESGPNGLLRHRIGPYCVGHGEGTWDLIPGDFS